MKVLFLIGRILFGGFFLTSGLNHFIHHAAMARMVAAGGQPLPELSIIGSGLLIFLGGTSILLGAWPRVGSVLIIIFLLVVTPIAHAFWTDTNSSARAEDINDFSKNVGLLGGAMMVLIISQPWPFSITGRVTRRKPVERD
jgi:putative oxidoreductase